ncbi:MAG: DNA recombination protein RmuC [Acidobacteriota bacterium]
MIVLIAVAGVLVGLLVGWLLAKARSTAALERTGAERDLALRERERIETSLATSRAALQAEQQLRITAETRLSDQQRQLESNFAFVQESRQQMEGAYARLSHDALNAAVERISQLVKPSLEGTKGEIVTTLNSKKTEIEALLQPLKEMLVQYQQEFRGTEEKRIGDQSSVQEQIRQLLEATRETRSEASKLSRALGSSKGGGNWGEVALRRCVEIAGLTEHCDFEVQSTFLNDEKHLVRPDMIVRLPHDRLIFVDAKAPKEAFDQAMAELDEPARVRLLEVHARNVRRHVEELSRRKYPTIDENSIDFTVLFMPSDQWLSAALAADPALFELSLGKKVILASPTLLIPVLRVVSSAWNVERAEENARKTLKIGQELYDRFVKVFDDVEGVGKALNGAVKKYNEAIRSIDTRLVPKVVELSRVVESSKETPELQPIDLTALESTKMPGPMRLPIAELQQEELFLEEPATEDEPENDEAAIAKG